MHEFRVLKILSFFAPLFRKFGVDYNTMEKILRLKLTMDGRRVPTMFHNEKPVKDGNQFIKSLWIYALYGLVLIPFFWIEGQYMFQMSIVFGILLFILTTSMISDFSSVLLDTRDRNILQITPVSRKTVNAAKFVHILIYLSAITIALAAIPLIVSLFLQGFAFSFIFLIELLLIIPLVIVMTSLLYFLVLRFFDGERLKDMINYVQILLSVGVVVGYQLLIHSFEWIDLNVSYSFQFWHLALPPMWYGAPFELLLASNRTVPVMTFTALSVVIPIFAIIVYSVMMPAFERNLEKMLGSVKSKKKRRYILDDLTAFLWCRREEQPFFRFAALMMRQERDFKLKVYPAIGMAVVFPFIFIVNDLQFRSIEEIGQGNMFLFIYMINFLIPGMAMMLDFSGSYKGGWLFKAAPIQQQSTAYSGALKAYIAKLYMPIFLVVALSYIAIFSFRILPDLFAVGIAGIAQTLLTFKVMSETSFPFTRSYEFAKDAHGAKALILSLFTLLFLAAHSLFRMAEYGTYLYIGLLLIAVFIAWRRLFPLKRSDATVKIDLRKKVN